MCGGAWCERARLELLNWETGMKTIRAKIPDKVYGQMERLVKEGWFKSEEDILELALRKFLNVNRPELLEKSILEDVEWGLRGGK